MDYRGNIRNSKRKIGCTKYINRVISSYVFACYSVLSDDNEKNKIEKNFLEKEKSKIKI